MKSSTVHPSSALAKIQKLYPDVTSVKDATKDIDITVTKIDVGSKAVRSHRECALAQATKRILGAEGAIVNVTTAYVIKGKTATRYKLPETVSREIVSFDRKAGFAIGDYHLHSPAPTDRLDGQSSGSRRKYKKGNGKPTKVMHFTGDVRTRGDLNS